MALASGLAAGENPVVVELFTSQGCSSCPPADRLLAELASRDDVIPLALHVDYWDYIGWKDVFGQPAFTRRQKGYARAGGWRTIYTPQMVINGTEDVVGSRPMKLAEIIQKHGALPDKVDLDIRREGGQLHIRAEALAEIGPCEIHVIRYEPKEAVDILRGENAGRRFVYTHIARGWEVVDRWNGKGRYETRVPLAGTAPVVVLVQGTRYGSIVAAARLR